MKGTTKLLTITAILALLTACGDATTSAPVSAPESVASVDSVIEESILEESIQEESILEESLVEEEPMVEDSTATMEQPEETPAPTQEPEEKPETLTAAKTTPTPVPTTAPVATAKPAATSAPAATAKPATSAKATPTPTPTTAPAVTSKPATTATPAVTSKPTATAAPTPTPAHVHSWVTVAATGHYETVQTGTQQVQVGSEHHREGRGWYTVYKCNQCGSLFSSGIDVSDHIVFGDCGAGYSMWDEASYYEEWDEPIYETKPVYEDVWVEDTPAYEKCSGCGQTR